MVHNLIVVGIWDAKLSQKLQMDAELNFQMDAELNLEKETKLVKENKAIKLQQTPVCPDNTTDVGAVSRKPSRCHGQQNKQLQKQMRTLPTQPFVTCSRWPYSRMQCPESDQVCHRCKKKGHFQKTL